MDTEKIGIGGATKVEAGRWLGFSRNGVGTFLDGMDITPFRGKYPWQRLIGGVLGVAPAVSETQGLTKQMLSLAEAASELGTSAEDLKADIEFGKRTVPPMYVFGTRRRRFICQQFLSFAKSPRAEFPTYDLIDERFCTAKALAAQMGEPVDDLTQKFIDFVLPEPPHLILAGGEKRYFKLRINAQSQQVSTEISRSPVPVISNFSGSVLDHVARSNQSGTAA